MTCDRGGATCGWRIGMLLVAAAVAVNAVGRTARAADAQTALPEAVPGTQFAFEVIESHDGKYLGDTPSHVGKDGGLTVRPRVALGDPVYRGTAAATAVVGRVTRVLWSRISGSLEIEFDPQPFERIAVGDEVWVDLNPVRPPRSTAPDARR